MNNKIPKIVHNIWIQGYDNLSDNLKINYQNTKQLNPDWEFWLWDDTSLKKLLQEYPAILDVYMNVHTMKGNINPFATQSDIGRYMILKRFGGVYFDVDFVFERPLDDIFDDTSAQFDIITADTSIQLLGIGLSSAKYSSCFVVITPEHPIWDSVIEHLQNEKNDKHQIGNAFDMQLSASGYLVHTTGKIKGPYCCNSEKDLVGYTPTSSSWNIWRPFLQVVNCHGGVLVAIIVAILMIIAGLLIYKYK